MDYRENDLVRIAKRENNTKRTYLVVDPLQGKHVPVQPSKALSLFDSLADKVRHIYKEEKLLLVGFAETATAIGAQVAISLGANYIQTTRENIPGVSYLFFSEAHSHATEQKLVKDDIDQVIRDIHRIIFIEDEVTTGNTIRNIIRIIKKEYGKDIKFAVASLINGMAGEHLEAYEKENIDLHYLVKTDHSRYGEIAEGFAGDGAYIAMDDAPSEISVLEVKGWVDARRIVDPVGYEDACKKLAEEVTDHLKTERASRILVVGSEEFMFPALFVGKELEKRGCEVRCHATTRSPIAVSSEDRYPLHCRYALRSLYDAGRETFLYDIDTYDQAVIVTDADLEDRRGLWSLVNALARKNKNITVVRWCR